MRRTHKDRTANDGITHCSSGLRTIRLAANVHRHALQARRCPPPLRSPPPAARSEGAGRCARPRVPDRLRCGRGAKKHDAIARADFNRFAVHLNIPVYWIADANDNKALDPDEVAPLLFYPTRRRRGSKASAFTPEFEAAYDKIVTASKRRSTESATTASAARWFAGSRRRAARRSSATTSRARPPRTRRSSRHMLAVGDLIDDLLRADERRDRARRQAARRPREPEPVPPQPRPEVRRPATEKDPACSAIPGAPKPSSISIRPSIQAKDDVLQGPRGAQGRRGRCWAASTSCAAAATSSKAVPYHRRLQGAR